MIKEYEISLSFAGEDREYVSRVANYLKGNGLSIFYDEFEESSLWGEDLYVYLDNIYRKSSRFCVMFISKHYAQKLWTNHERKSIQAKDFVNSHESNILPARFDDTEIPGIRPTIGYIDLQNKTPEQLGHLILEKVYGQRQIAFRKSLNRAYQLIDNFFEPNTLSFTDSIAQEIRIAFSENGFVPEEEIVKPFIDSEDVRERLIGYLSYQIAPFWWVGQLWNNAISKEMKFIEISKDTRPLWQLLVCIGLFGAVTNPEEMQSNKIELLKLKDFLLNDKDVDKGGECVQKIKGLINVFPWMTAYGGKYTHFTDNKIWEFHWNNGFKTKGLLQTVRFIINNPQIAQHHINAGHFNPWYSINIYPEQTTNDLLAVISKEISNNNEFS